MLASAAMFSRVARAVSMPAAVTAAVKGDLAWFDDAALAYDEEELRAMLDRQESDHGYGALATAVMRGDEATAKKVLSMGADARSEDHEGHTPMSMAAVSGKLNMVKLLREHGVDAGRARARRIHGAAARDVGRDGGARGGRAVSRARVRDGRG